MMKKIVVGYHGSDTGKAALALAKDQAKAFGARVFVIESKVGGSDWEKAAQQVGVKDIQDIKEDEENLEFAESYLKEQDIPCETHLLARGVEPGEDIVQFAKDNDVDLIIIGVHRKSKLEKLVFGSTAQFVILKAPCPVLTVK
jgi:nucleotide-binding universal stress UspA family protein